MIVIDFETYYSSDFSLTKLNTRDYVTDPQFHVIGMGTVDPSTKRRRWFTGEAVRHELDRLFDRQDPPEVLAHNMRFDGAVLKWHYGINPPFYYDSMSMARAWLSPYTGSASLAACAEYLGLPAKGSAVVQAKGMRLQDFTPAELEAYGEYCMHDAWLSWRIFEHLLPHFPESELRAINTTLRMYLEPRLRLNEAVLEGNIRAEKARREQAVKDGGVPISVLRSRDKFALQLHEHGVSPPTKTSPRTGEETYAMAATDTEFTNLQNSPEVGHLVRARLAVTSNIELTRTERLIDRAKRYGDLSVPYLYYGAHTGRYTGDEKINLQNLPRGSALRKAIEAPPGHTIVAIDYASLEARLLAWWSGESELCQQFAQGEDVYSSFASRLFKKPVSKELDPGARTIGKIAVLSLGYYAGAKRFYNMLLGQGVRPHVAREVAEPTVELYRSTFRKIKAGWHHQGDIARALVHKQWASEMLLAQGLDLYTQVWDTTTGEVRLPDGMRLIYPDVQDGEIYIDPSHSYARQGEITYQFGKDRKKLHGGVLTENWIQALGRKVAFAHMLELEQYYPPVMQIHDENVFLVPTDEVEDFCALATEVMTTPPSWAPSLPLAVEIGTGDTYGDCK